MTSGAHDKAGEAYWSGIWAAGERPRPVNLAERGFRNHFRLSLHKKRAGDDKADGHVRRPVHDAGVHDSLAVQA
jgi:hypothetical protein